MGDETRFTIPIPNLPKGKRVTLDEAEVLLRARLEEKRSEYMEAVWQLVRLYSSTNRQDVAGNYISFLMTLTDDPEVQALFWLELGKLMEQVHNFPGAIQYYKQAFSLEPTQSTTWYFINNNLGYSLLQEGAFQEAEPYCRAAIAIDTARQNAHKNLGLSLEGQGAYAEAAKSYVAAIQANAADPRSLRHLESLVASHPEVLSQVPNIDILLTRSREAVDLATKITDAAVKSQMESSEDLTSAQRLLVAVGRIVLIDAQSEFSTEDLITTLSISIAEWRTAYASVFYAMREGSRLSQPAGSTEYSGIFREPRPGVFVLTGRGLAAVQKLHKL